MPCAISPLALTRAALLTAITITNLASTAIMCLAITFGSGGVFQSVLMGLNGFACLLPAAYWLHKIVFEGEYVFVRSMTTFSLLSLIGFVSVIIILIRNEEQDGLALMRDFALLDHPARIAKASIALAMMSASFSVTGFLVAYMGWMSQRAEKNPADRSPNATAESVATRQTHDQPARFHFANSSESTLVPPFDLEVNKGRWPSIPMKEFPVRQF